MLVGSVAGVTEGERVELGTLHDYDFDVKATVQPPILDPMATLIFFFHTCYPLRFCPKVRSFRL